MTKIILNEREYSFEYYEDSNLWRGHINFDEYDIPIEILDIKDIETIQLEIDNFYLFIESGFIKNLIKQSEAILLSFIGIVPFGIADEISKYHFKLEAINYKGLKQGFVFGNETFRYELLFKLYNEKYTEPDDPYGNYLVDIDNGLILGLRREQV